MVIIPAGFTTDFASIPRIAWNILDPEDPCIGWPSVAHDYLYSNAGTLADGFVYTRDQADDVLAELMDFCGAGSFVRWAVKQAVNRFGSSHWLPAQKAA